MRRDPFFVLFVLLLFPLRLRKVKRCDDTKGAKKGHAPARGLLVHFHGGGFVANSSQSHESYLRLWAKTLMVPIFSVDYTLAQNASFPRAAEECFLAYVAANARSLSPKKKKRKKKKEGKKEETRRKRKKRMKKKAKGGNEKG